MKAQIFSLAILLFARPVPQTVEPLLTTTPAINADWSDHAKSLRGRNGERFTVVCESNGTLSRRVWGTETYTDDSSICTAAVHAGLLTTTGGTVMIEIRPGAASYASSSRHGVTTRRSGRFGGSFVFVTRAGRPAGMIDAKPNLAGTWYVDGDQDMPVAIRQYVNSLTFTDEHGDTSRGRFLSSSVIVADEWDGGLRGRIAANHRRIDWDDGSTWLRSITADEDREVRRGELGPAEILGSFLDSGAIRLEQDTERPGGDYVYYELPAARPELCRAACEADAQCRAFTYVKPGVQGTAARCWLKSRVTATVPNANCISGVKNIEP